MEIKTIRVSYDLLGNIVDSYENFIENGNYVYKLELALNLGTNEEIYYNVRRADSSINTNPIKVINNIIELNAWHTEVPGVLEITPFIYNSETAQRKFYQTVILNVENYLYSGVSSENYETPAVSFAAFNLESNPFSNILKVKYDLKGIPNGWENSYIGSIYRGSNAADKIQVEFEESIPNSNTVVFMAKRPDGTTTSEYLSMTRVNSHTYEFYLVDWFTIDSGNMECNVQVIGNVENNTQQRRTYGIFNIQIKDTVRASTEEITTDLDIITQILNRLSTVENQIEELDESVVHLEGDETVRKKIF